MAFSLNDIRSSTAISAPPRIVIYGTPGIGKSSFAASAPNPIFLRTEDGAIALDVPTLPLIRTLGGGAGLMDAFELLATQQHSFQTVVLDSADWMENILKEQVAFDYGLKSYDSNAKALAYGRGSRAIEEYWRTILKCFDDLRAIRNMGVVIVAHSQIKRMDDPMTESYDRYIPDLTKESSAVLVEWADIVLFATQKVNVIKENVGVNGVKKRAIGPPERFIYTQETPAFRAKCRWPVPAELPLVQGRGYAVLMEEIAKTMQSASQQPAAA